MKRIVFILSIFFYFNSSAQDPYYKKFQDMLKTDSLKNWKIFDMRIDSSQVLKNRIDALSNDPIGRLMFVQANGTRVYALPQDNMPCIVPDNRNYNIPNPGKGKRVDGMPPGTSPKQKIIPDNKND